ncbi:AAA domain-containing protein [Halanaerobaculum tunisiense]
MAQSELVDRTTRLFDYLDDIVKLGHKVVYRLEDHNKFLLYQDQLPEVDDIKIADQFYHLQDSLLELKRSDLPPQPTLPTILEGWVEVAEDPTTEPKIISPQLEKEAKGKRKFYDLPERRIAFIEYIKKWREWAKEVQPLQENINLFDELFNVHKELQYEENLELVLGYGLVVWKENNQLIKHPLLTQNMIIKHQAKENKMKVVVPDDADWSLELEPLIDIGVTKVENIRKVFNDLKHEHDNPYLDLFYEASGLTADGRVVDFAKQNLRPTKNLKIVNGWVLFVRKRNQNELLKDIREFNRQLEEEDIKLPGSLERIISEPEQDSFSWEQRDFHDEWTGLLDQEVLFPKAANEEQIQILDCLEQSDGVLVQGPPGTGKSHTIANLVSHFMAQGQRVLVTSQKDQALKVLRDMLPESLRALCMSVLQDDANRKQKLEEAVSYISEIVSNEQHSKLKEDVKELKDKFSTHKKRLQKIETELKHLAEAELQVMTASLNYPLTPAEVAKKITEEESDYDWFIDQPDYKAKRTKLDNQDVIKLEAEIPITDSEFEELITLRAKLLPRLNELSNYKIPKLSNLVTPEEFRELAQGLDKINQLEEKAADYFSDLLLTADQDLDQVLTLVAEGVEVYNLIKGSWAYTLIKEKTELKDQLQDAIDELDSIFITIDNLQQSLSLMTNIELKSDVALVDYKDFVDYVLERVKSGKDLWSWLSFITKFFDGGKAEALQEVRVNNKQPSEQEDWQQVKKYIELKLKINEFITAWSGLRQNLGNQLPELSAEADFQSIKEVHQKLKSAFEYQYQLKPKLQTELAQSIVGVDKVIDQRLDQELENIYQALKIKQEQKEFTEAKKTYQELKENLTILQEEKAHPVVEDLVACLPADLAQVKEKTSQWEVSYKQVKELENFTPDYQQFKKLVDKLATQAPNWANNWLDPNLKQEDLQLNSWEEAWEHAILDSYLDDIAQRESKIAQLETEQEKFEQELRDIKEKLVLVMTKLNLQENISQADVNALNAWKKAIKRLGKGTGKYAPKWRKEAQKHMQEAKNAVPVWVMSVYRISETIPKEFGCFDVLIIDEASQCDIRSLLALSRAKKVIVVGDDQQISPSAVGIPHDQVNSFIEQHLEDVPYSNMMDLKTSLYDIADMLFDAQAKLMLKEHFRCVPEIIEFSNQEFYNQEILPLRNVPESEKLKPTLESNLIEEGYIDDRGRINKPEAEAICKKLKELANDPRYEDKTFGVISLKGKAQAKYIFNEIDNHLTPREQEEHDFLAGDAYAFQGDERDVIILSMVVANNRRFRALTKESEKQRFNVAVSRAKDQLILFHSVELGADLQNLKDMRYKLLNYIENGIVGREELENPKEVMDSPFEEEVYDWLTERGYQVTPQVEVGNYRIDLVVEGIKNRLAVECDGDRWHPPEKWWDDRMRQRQLERVGWKFWRVSGTEFYRDPEGAMKSILPRLEELGIKPRLKEEIKEVAVTKEE